MASTSLEKQRQWFGEAKAALESGDMARFGALKNRLAGYPLAPYLEIWKARKQLDQHRDDIVLQVLDKHASIPEAVDLQLDYINNLAERGQWPHVVVCFDRYPEARERLPEIHMLANWYSGRKEEALRLYSMRWQRGRDTSDLTYRLEQKWREAGHPTRNESWRRLGFFARSGNWKGAGEVAHGLSGVDRNRVERWKQLQRDPLNVLRRWKPDGRHPAEAAMVEDGLQRLSRQDAVAAWQLFDRFETLFEKDEMWRLRKKIALRAATERHLEAAGWLSELPESVQSENTRAWHIRLHLLYGKWGDALSAIRALPQGERENSCWSYWQARALEELGREEEAKALFLKGSTGRGFYSFICAEHLGIPYLMGASDLEASSADVRKFRKSPAVVRAYEWWQLGDRGRASREWYQALQYATADQWSAAAWIAARWNWHDRAIHAAFRSGHHDALKYRFPTAFSQVVTETSQESGLSPSLIWSIIRQESAFNSSAVSRTGAMGLMQLRPTTAREVAEKYGIAEESPDLFDPATNIRLGALYLSGMLKRFDGNRAVAAAAYNAGPKRVSQWLEASPFKQADIWIETIPYAETRRYVQQVLAFTVVYDWRQSKAPTGIVARIDQTDEEG